MPFLPEIPIAPAYSVVFLSCHSLRLFISILACILGHGVSICLSGIIQYKVPIHAVILMYFTFLCPFSPYKIKGEIDLAAEMCSMNSIKELY